MWSGSSSTGGASVSTTNDSAGPMLRMSMVSPAKTQRWACGWKLCQFIPRSRLKTYQRMRCPLWATMVGVLPTNERPLKQSDGRLEPPDSTTLWLVVPAFVQRTRPPTPTVTSAGVKAFAAVACTSTRFGPPACTVIRPAIDGPCTPQK